MWFSFHKASSASSEITGMVNLRPISTLRLEDVQDVIRTSVRPQFNADAIADFIASVDWSGPSTPPPVAVVLGQLEGWASEFADGHLPLATYVGHLLQLLPVGERAIYFVGGGGKVTITHPRGRPEPTPRAQPEQRLQTGSRASIRSVSVVSNSDTVPVL